jgi:hypothetical protein
VRAVCQVERICHDKGQAKREVRYFITSLRPSTLPPTLLRLVRAVGHREQAALCP